MARVSLSSSLDTNIIPILICTIISRHVIKGLAYAPWLMYLGSGVDLLGHYVFSTARSATSKCVEMHELYSIQSLVSMAMAMTQVSASLWKVTSGVPGLGGTQWVGSGPASSCLPWSTALHWCCPWCSLKGSRIKGSRFIVSRLSFSLDSRDGFLYPGRYEICPGRFDPHDCTPNYRDAMNKLCTHTTYHKGTLVYTHNVPIC